ncbi:MAG: gas vesicle protein GvpO [Chlorobiaceae bacterium]
MSKIIEVRNTVIKFLKENIKTTEVTVIKVEKNGESWKAVAEVYEEDSFLKSMNLPPKKVRLFYAVVVDSELEVISFNRLNNYDDTESDND